MYNKHFGFRESPFSAAPSPRFFYTNEQYQEALANLRYGIEWKKGLIVMTGEVGTGKTTLLDKTMRSLEATTHPVFVSYNHLTYAELLRLISKELGLPGDGQDRIGTTEQLRACLLSQHEKGHIVALLIDEAQSLSDDMFEDIRFLSNLEAEEQKLLQIVLTGQPELERRLDALNLRNIKQRVVVHCRLAPLQHDEVGRYIETRLRQAGHDSGELFQRNAVDEIAGCTAGIPRLINIVCDNALLLAFAQSKNRVTAEMVCEAARDLRLKTSPKPPVDSTDSSESHLNLSLSTHSDGSAHRLRFATQPGGHRRRGFARTAAGMALGLFTIGAASGALYWSKTSGSFNDATSSETGSRVAELKNELTQSMPAARNVVARETIEEDPPRPPAKFETTTPKTERLKNKDEPVAAKDKASRLGNFEVTGPSSFVRNSPRSEAKVIATLVSGTELKVLSKRGDYFRVQAIVDGQMIRGYVHREDAFFEHVKKRDRQQESPAQSKSASRPNPERDVPGSEASKPVDKNPPLP